MRLGLTAVWLVSVLPYLVRVSGMEAERRLELREETRKLFQHGFDGYLEYAYPADELRSLTCTPLHRDPNPGNFGINDIHANVSMTLLDTLSSLPMLHPSAFPLALHQVATEISFDQDVKVQVFEMTIRAMGSLLSTYQYLERLSIVQVEHGGDHKWDQEERKALKEYQPRLLEMALDLGKRLAPAFTTTTGLPYARVNLRHGVEKGESIETCTAGAGSLILEFAVLTRLTADERFEALAQRAYLAIWNRRSTLNLLGNSIGVTHGLWLAPGMSSVGAGMDSFFEYGIKAAILLGDDMYLDIFQDSYAALQTHVRTSDGFIYRPIQFRLLQLSAPSLIDSLAAFLPGMQVLAGDIESAIKSHLVYWNIWRKYSAIPESWDWQKREVEWAGWPGRPEFIESTFYLYKATKDPFYLRIGERVLNDVKRRTMTACGFATMKNVETGELDDRMESFVLSETLKYLYLLFDDTPSTLSNQVFTTEGHALSLPLPLLRPPTSIRRQLHRGENVYCPTYTPPTVNGMVVGIEQRADYDYARSLVFGPGTEGVDIEGKASTRLGWWEGGFCEIPVVPKHSFEIVLAPLNVSEDAPTPPEDAAPSKKKVHQDEKTGNFWIHNIEGLRLGVRWRYDNMGYDVNNIGPHRVRPGQAVIVTDPKMEGFLPVPTKPPITTHSPSEVLLRFSTMSTKSRSKLQTEVFLHGMAATATFGKDFGASTTSQSTGFALNGPLIILKRPKTNVDGCNAFPSSEMIGKKGPKAILILDRGGCTFFHKSLNAKEAGAAGVIIVGYPPAEVYAEGAVVFEGDMENQGDVAEVGEGLIRPSADQEPDYLIQQLGDDFGVIYVEHIVGGAVVNAMSGKKGVDVGVEIFDLHTVMGVETIVDESAKSEREKRDERSRKSQEDRRREGRVMVNGWDIRNLRIVDKPPD